MVTLQTTVSDLQQFCESVEVVLGRLIGKMSHSKDRDALIDLMQEAKKIQDRAEDSVEQAMENIADAIRRF